MGRWMPPDPAGLAAADPANPQSWNRYAYVLNAPTELTDPLGLCDVSDISCLSGPYGGPSVSPPILRVTNPGLGSAFMPSSSGVCARTLPGGPQILAGRAPLGLPLNCPVPSPTPTQTPPSLNDTIASSLSYLQYFLAQNPLVPSPRLPTPEEITRALFSYPSLNPTAATESEALYCDQLARANPSLGTQCLQFLQTPTGTIPGLPGNGWGALPGSAGGGWGDRCWANFSNACLGVPPTGVGWDQGGNKSCWNNGVDITCLIDLN
jgi:hypothetical protein